MVLHVEVEMPAAEQTESFQTLLAQSLGTECSLDVVQKIAFPFFQGHFFKPAAILPGKTVSTFEG